MECDRNTLVASIMRAAQMGLIIDGVESALVPRKAKCTLMVMYQGLLKMVRNSGELKDIQSAVVYEKDEFDYYTDETGEHLKHRRFWGDRGQRKLVFAIARTKDGGIYVEVMDATQVSAVQKQGYNGADSPWNGPFADEMWRKSVIRRMAKRLPSSSDMESFSQALHEDDDIFNGDDDDKPEVTPETGAKPAVSSALAAAVGATPAPEPATPAKQEAPEGTLAVIGLVEEVIDREYPTDSGVVKRCAAKIAGVNYGTSNEQFAAIIKTAHRLKIELTIAYLPTLNATGKTINEIIDIGNANTDEKPI